MYNYNIHIDVYVSRYILHLYIHKRKKIKDGLLKYFTIPDDIEK